mmetsp:Transcript_82022/g.237829  ORF Transcript_82022/g.237829 Transcript_82022/m.237829 type:complete len:122 (-) Transcript_82022:136-501(-)
MEKTGETYTLIGFERRAGKGKVGCKPEKLSPLHSVHSRTPDGVIAFHGDADTTVTIKSVELFCDAINGEGKFAVLHCCLGRAHGFFKQNKTFEGVSNYEDAITKLDATLVKMGWLREAACG